MDLKPGTIQHLQEQIDHNIKKWGFEDESLPERLLLLVEEVGELVNDCRKISGMYNDQKRSLKSSAGENVVDVINMVFAVAIKLGVNVEEEFFKKVKKIKNREYKRTTKKV